MRAFVAIALLLMLLMLAGGYLSQRLGLPAAVPCIVLAFALGCWGDSILRTGRRA